MIERTKMIAREIAWLPVIVVALVVVGAVLTLIGIAGSPFATGIGAVALFSSIPLAILAIRS